MLINIFQFLNKSPGFMKYFKNISWLFAEKTLRMVVGLFVGIWVARYLGPEQFGLFSYAQSFVGLFIVISSLGLDGIIIRELVKEPQKENSLLSTAFILKFIGAIVTLVILAIVTFLISNDDYTNKLIFIIASAVIFKSFNIVDLYFQAKVLSKYVVFSNIFSLFFSSLLKIYLIFIQASLEAFVWVVVFDSIIMALSYIYWYWKLKKDLLIFKFKFDFDLAKSLLKDSWPLILSSMAIAIYMKIDQIMIKDILNNEAVGNYAAAVRLSEAWYFIPMILASSLFPAIINAKKISEELYYKRLQQLYDLMVWMAIAIALPMTFLSDWIVDFLYGSEYNNAGSVLMIHIWAGIFVFSGVASGKWLLTENLQMYALINTAIGTIVNIVLNYILIPKIGVEGAALATLFSYFFSAYLCLLFWRKTRINFINLSKTLLITRVFSVKKIS